MEQSRSMQIEAFLPPSMGPEAFFAAGYTLNRTPNEQLGWKTPYEVAYGKPPSLTHMYEYGCKAYALNKRIKKGRQAGSSCSDWALSRLRFNQYISNMDSKPLQSHSNQRRYI